MPAADELPEPVVPVPPAAPAVVPPAVEPLLVVPEVVPVRGVVELDMLAFVKMNDAVLALPDVERDALVPDVELALVEPVVPVAPAPSPCCRQPVTVIVPLCPDRFAPLCGDVWLLPACAATIAVHPKPIANIHAARFINASCL